MADREQAIAIEPIIEPPEPVIQQVLIGLSFGDGFQFGCGFFVAGLIAMLIVLLITLLILLALSLAGVGLFSNFLGAAGSLLAGLI